MTIKMWAKAAVESDDFGEIVKIYRLKNSYNNMIETHVCNAITLINYNIYNILWYVYIISNGNRIYIMKTG